MACRMAGVDVHKKKLAVVVADVEVDDEYRFERRWFGSNPEQLRALSQWLIGEFGAATGAAEEWRFYGIDRAAEPSDCG